jgi:myo-inositol-1(or 4)-monophosphatase
VSGGRSRLGTPSASVWSDDVVSEAPSTSPNQPPSTSDRPADLRLVAERVAVEAAGYLNTLPRPWDAAQGEGGSADGVRTKSSPTDVVTASDNAVETLIRSLLAELRPGDPVVGEEQGGAGTAAGPTGVCWVVDPIDGTVNFLYGMPWYSVSVAAVRDGRSLAGAVAEPASGRLWSAAAGAGATCDARPLRVSGATEAAMSLMATGYSYLAQRRARQAAMIAGMLPLVRDVRRAGSATLEMCAVAAGWIDAFLEHGLNWWDWAAASLIAAEAGAAVRVPGAPGTAPPADGLGDDAILVATPAVFGAIADLAREHGAGTV